MIDFPSAEIRILVFFEVSYEDFVCEWMPENGSYSERDTS